MEPVTPYVSARVSENTSVVVRVKGNGGSIVSIKGQSYLKPFSEVVVTTHPQIADILVTVLSKTLLGDSLERGERDALEYYRAWDRVPANDGKAFRPNWYQFYKMSRGEISLLAPIEIDPGQGGHPC